MRYNKKCNDIILTFSHYISIYTFSLCYSDSFIPTHVPVSDPRHSDIGMTLGDFILGVKLTNFKKLTRRILGHVPMSDTHTQVQVTSF